MLLVLEAMNFDVVRSSAFVLLYSTGYTNAAAAEFAREQENQLDN
jgi:hypothetical protein